MKVCSISKKRFVLKRMEDHTVTTQDDNVIIRENVDLYPIAEIICIKPFLMKTTSRKINLIKCND